MESLRLAFSVVGPLLVYMVVGALIRSSGIFTRENFKALNQVLFRVLIPLSLFFSICGSDLNEAADPKLFLLSEILVIGSCVFFWFFLAKRIPDKGDRATIVQGIFRSNLVLYGGAVAASLCDENGIALIAALTALIVPTINIEGVVLFELARGGQIRIADLIKRIVTNPLVIAGVLGTLFAVLSLSLPEFLDVPLRNLGKAATPLGLVTLGGILSFESIRSHAGYLRLTVALKLVVIPLIAVLAAGAMGYRGGGIAAILAVFASPTAVASAPMAQAMGGNGDLAGEIVAATSVFSLLTMFLFIFVLSGAGWL